MLVVVWLLSEVGIFYVYLIRQNRIMALLTVISSIFMPLTLIAGWYGMNFRYMPELEYRVSYPMVLVICIVIVVVSLWWFRKQKWL